MSASPPDRLHQRKFGSILVANLWWLLLPFFLALTILSPYIQPLLVTAMTAEAPTVFGLPLVAAGVAPVGVVSIGPLAVGLISVGGVGVISFGGIGLVSFGGAALGAIALGGAACGLIAIGGAAFGYVAVGGGAAGVYVLAGAGKGRHVFDRRRQDPEAVAFFCKYVPRLRQALAGG